MIRVVMTIYALRKGTTNDGFAKIGVWSIGQTECAL